jgi:hypothetical protein
MNLRTHEEGGICCSSINNRGQHVAPAHMCEKCRSHFSALRFRTQEGNMDDFTPPDPYQKGLADLRRAEAKAAAARSGQPAPRPTTLRLDHNGIPDPYATGLAKMRSEGR